MSSSEEGLREMVKVFKKYLLQKKLDLNTVKSKIMIMKDRRSKKTKLNKDILWNNEKIEVVDKFNYLGYLITNNNKDDEHVKNQSAKAKALLGRIWGKGQRLLCNEWKERWKLYNLMIRSIAFYGVEIWGWKKFECLEAIQKKYIKWVLMLDKNTPDYIVRRETKTTKIINETRRRAAIYEEKITKLNEGDLRLKIFKRKYLCNEKSRYVEEKIKSLNEIGVNCEKIDEWLRNGLIVSEKIKEEGILATKDEDMKSIAESRYINGIKIAEGLIEEWRKDELPQYLDKAYNIQNIARYRTGCVFKSSKFWRNREERKCRLCKLEEESASHLFEECVNNPIKCELRKVLNEDGKGLSFILGMNWRLKRHKDKEDTQ